MQPLPSYNYFAQLNPEFTTAQLATLAGLAYAITVLFLLQMVLILHNFWVFIIQQGKYKTVKPLLVLYIILFLLTCSRIFFSVTFFAQ